MPTRGTILLVEDNPNDVELTQIAFESNQISNSIVVANDGVEALDYLMGTGVHAGRDVHDPPQLIILDLKMPKISGLEVLSHIREHEVLRFIPVVILTSSREEQDMLKAYSLGANAYVHKPIDFNQFLDVVKSLSLFWLSLNEYPHL